ncbi:MAG: hypothetical protein K0R44_19 [Thermomicrobiales bacterium]|nr:hypothetical protein [Thermomicrobiales bacterium]MDF3014794.1 hypothetical protein [Thermomicrobiales bacterium]
MPDWKRGRWFRVLAPDGSLWCETSDGREAVTRMRSGDMLYKEWRREEIEWRPESADNWKPYDWDEDG